MKRGAVVVVVVAALIAVAALALAGWAVVRVRSIERQRTTPTVTIPSTNGQPATMDQLQQAVAAEAQQLAAQKQTYDGALAALAYRSGCTNERDVDGNTWYDCPTVGGSSVTVP